MPLWAASAFAVLTVLSIAISVTTLMILQRAAAVSPANLSADVHTLQQDLNELHDKVDHWQRRDRVRGLRAGKEAAAEAAAQVVPVRGSPDYKAMLRNRMMMKGRVA